MLDHSVGVSSMRTQLGIRKNDVQFFVPVTIKEALAAAAIMRGDALIRPSVRKLLDVGLILELVPSSLLPSRSDIARSLAISVRTLRRRELLWECLDPVDRFGMTQWSYRLVVALRAGRLAES